MSRMAPNPENLRHQQAPLVYDAEAAAFSLVMTILERLEPAERERVMARACLWAGVG